MSNPVLLIIATICTFACLIDLGILAAANGALAVLNFGLYVASLINERGQ